MKTFMGMRIVATPLLTIPAEDWSRVRSPSRARRRMRCGHRQNVRHYDAPSPKAIIVDGVVYCHPDIIAEISRRADSLGSFL